LIGGKTDKEICEWANGIGSGGNSDGKGALASIKDTKDKSLSDGRFLMHILADIEPRAVNWDIMMDTTEGDDDEKEKDK